MAPLFRRNDDAQFERLYQAHVKDVYRYSYAVLGERADAEDVTQTTFMNAYRAFQRGERPEKPQNWLISIAHNVCRQRFRQQQRRPNEVEFEEAIASASEESEGPSAEDLRRAFQQLPPNQRAALVMRELEGRSYAEIAEVLGITVSALETLLFRARRALREQLEEQLTCSEAAFAISKQFDGRLSSEEQRALRAHLRACPECTSAAQRQRAQRRALRSMLAVPLPQSLSSFFGGATAASTSAAAAGVSGVAFKAAAVLVAGVAVGGGTYVGVKEKPFVHHGRTVQTAVAAPAPVRAEAVAPAAVPHAAAATAATAQARPKAHAKSVHDKRAHAPKQAPTSVAPAIVDEGQGEPAAAKPGAVPPAGARAAPQANAHAARAAKQAKAGAKPQGHAKRTAPARTRTTADALHGRSGQARSSDPKRKAQTKTKTQSGQSAPKQGGAGNGNAGGNGNGNPHGSTTPGQTLPVAEPQAPPATLPGGQGDPAGGPTATNPLQTVTDQTKKQLDQLPPPLPGSGKKKSLAGQ